MMSNIKALKYKVRELEKSGEIESEECRSFQKDADQIGHDLATRNSKELGRHIDEFCDDLLKIFKRRK